MSEQSVADSFAEQLKTFFYATVGKVAELQTLKIFTWAATAVNETVLATETMFSAMTQIALRNSL